jgi:hypothetical protein
LYLQEIPVVEVLANVLDNLGTSDEGIADGVVHDEVKEPLPVSLFLVFETEILCRQLMETGRKQDDLPREDTDLAFSTFLGVCSTGKPNNSNPVSASQMLVLIEERNIALGFLLLAYNLKHDALALAVIEAERTRSFSVTAKGNFWATYGPEARLVMMRTPTRISLSGSISPLVRCAYSLTKSPNLVFT